MESAGDSWNLWVKDNLIENCVQKGIRLEEGVSAGVILKSYFLNNYYANGVDIELGALDGTTGKVRLCQFHNNQHFNTIGIDFKMSRKVEQILVMGHLFYRNAWNAINIDDYGKANKFQSITIGSLNIDSKGTTPNGVNLQSYSNYMVIGDHIVTLEEEWCITYTHCCRNEEGPTSTL